MEWKWKVFPLEFDGTYEGEVREVKGELVPHGCGRWKGKYVGYELIIEGEWKEGRVNGKAVNYYDDGEEIQWRTKDGSLCQKIIHFMQDDSHW